MSDNAHTPTPWTACHEGKCQCKQVWSKPADHPVATITSGEWGDSYPALRFIGPDGKEAEAYTKHIAYGSVDPSVAEANAQFIVRACNSHDELLEALERIAREVEIGNRGEGVLLSIKAWARAAIAKAKGKR